MSSTRGSGEKTMPNRREFLIKAAAAGSVMAFSAGNAAAHSPGGSVQVTLADTLRFLKTQPPPSTGDRRISAKGGWGIRARPAALAGISAA